MHECSKYFQPFNILSFSLQDAMDTDLVEHLVLMHISKNSLIGFYAKFVKDTNFQSRMIVDFWGCKILKFIKAPTQSWFKKKTYQYVSFSRCSVFYALKLRIVEPSIVGINIFIIHLYFGRKESVSSATSSRETPETHNFAQFSPIRSSLSDCETAQKL